MELRKISTISSLVFCLLSAPALAVNEWQEGIYYKVGDIVSWSGVNYKAIQQHTAYAGTNWRPDITPTLWAVSDDAAPAPEEEAEEQNNAGDDDVCGGQNTDACTAEEEQESVLAVDFENRDEGLYQAADFKRDWGISPPQSSGLAAGRLAIVADPLNASNKALRVTYNAGEVGGKSAMVFNVPLKDNAKSLWFQYRVMFASDFTWVKGGKLPGLGGADHPSGCIDNGTFDGFTTRLMWRENGSAFGYLYFPEKKERCGDYAATYTHFTKGTWHTLTQHVVLNDTGKSNGSFTQYIDDEKVLDLKDQELRKGDKVSIDVIKMDTFFGGSTAAWAPKTAQHAWFDDFKVTTNSPLKPAKDR